MYHHHLHPYTFFLRRSRWWIVQLELSRSVDRKLDAPNRLHIRKVGTTQKRLTKVQEHEEFGNLCGASLIGVSSNKSMKPMLMLNTATILGVELISFTRKGIGIS